MPDEHLLRTKARAAMEAGAIPSTRPDRTWGGPGVGARCVICEQPVTKDELELEVEFVHNGGQPGLDSCHVHIRCFAAWEFERRALTGRPDP
jgi:hypothetical protein